MKLQELKKIIREEIALSLKEAVTPDTMKSQLLKIKSVIGSCKTKEQLDSVNNMLANFMHNLKMTVNDLGAYSLMKFSKDIMQSGVYNLYMDVEDSLAEKKKMIK